MSWTWRGFTWELGEAVVHMFDNPDEVGIIFIERRLSLFQKRTDLQDILFGCGVSCFESFLRVRALLQSSNQKKKRRGLDRRRICEFSSYQPPLAVYDKHCFINTLCNSSQEKSCISFKKPFDVFRQ